MEMDLTILHPGQLTDCILLYWSSRPEEVYLMLYDQWKDDPLYTIKVIGIKNIFSLGFPLFINKAI